MTLSITAIGQAVDVTGILVVGTLGALLLMVVWIVVGLRTIRLVRRSATR
jgi:hypothetical protein